MAPVGAAPVVRERAGEIAADCEAVARESDGRHDQVLPRHAAEASVSRVQAWHYGRRGDGDPSVERLRRVAGDAQERRVEPAGGPCVQIDLNGFALGRGVDEKTAVAADTAACRVDDGKCERCGDGCVDCGSPLCQRDRTGIGGRLVRRHHKAARNSLALRSVHLRWILTGGARAIWDSDSTAGGRVR